MRHVGFLRLVAIKVVVAHIQVTDIAAIDVDVTRVDIDVVVMHRPITARAPATVPMVMVPAMMTVPVTTGMEPHPERPPAPA